MPYSDDTFRSYAPDGPPPGSAPISHLCFSHPDVIEALASKLRSIFSTVIVENNGIYFNHNHNDVSGFSLLFFGSFYLNRISCASYEFDSTGEKKLVPGLSGTYKPWNDNVAGDFSLAFASSFLKMFDLLSQGKLQLWGRHPGPLSPGRVLPSDSLPLRIPDWDFDNERISLADGTYVYGCHLFRPAEVEIRGRPKHSLRAVATAFALEKFDYYGGYDPESSEWPRRARAIETLEMHAQRQGWEISRTTLASCVDDAKDQHESRKRK